MTSEQRPPVNNGHYLGVPRIVVVHKFDCADLLEILISATEELDVHKCETIKITDNNSTLYFWPNSIQTKDAFT